MKKWLVTFSLFFSVSALGLESKCHGVWFGKTSKIYSKSDLF